MIMKLFTKKLKEKMTKQISEINLDEIIGVNKKYVKNDQEHYVLFKPQCEGFTYDINKNRCDTTEKLLNWILHLNEKQWITPKHISSLISTFMEDNNLPKKLS